VVWESFKIWATLVSSVHIVIWSFLPFKI
jgi:hypothetical protein